MFKIYLYLLSDILFIVYASLSIAKHGADALSILVIAVSAVAFVLGLVEVFKRG